MRIVFSAKDYNNYARFFSLIPRYVPVMCVEEHARQTPLPARISDTVLKYDRRRALVWLGELYRMWTSSGYTYALILEDENHA